MREDWIEYKLGEIHTIVYGKGLPTKNLTSNGYPVFGANGIIGYYTEYKYENQQILISCRGAASGAINVSPKKCFITNNSLIVETDSIPYIEKSFLYYILQGANRTQIITGSAQPQVTINNANTLVLKLAPLPIQRAIVLKIENLFASLDKGIADLKTAQEQLKVYRQAVLKKAFEGEFTKEWRAKNPYSLNDFLNELKKEKSEAIKSKLIAKDEYFPEFSDKDLVYKMPDNWICLPWKTLTSNNKYAMKRGPFGSALKKEFFVDNGYVVYEQGHAINDEPYRHRYFITPEKYEEMKAFSVKGGDMIISCSGVTLGRICLLPNDADAGIINQALLKIDMDERIMLKNYFVMLFRSETFQRLIFGKSLGTAMPNMVGMPELKQIPIPVPSINEQKQIIKEIETRLSVCDKVEQSISEALEKAEALRQSILKKAFEGKLLSEAEIAKCKQEADYEPAAKLLERIKTTPKG